MSQEDPPRNGLGSAALVLGLVALPFVFVPIIGEFVAAPAALLAIVLGLVGLGRVDRGIATNGGEALAGSILGLVSAFVMFLIIAATVGPAE
jgi:hypothetical protein